MICNSKNSCTSYGLISLDLMQFAEATTKCSEWYQSRLDSLEQRLNVRRAAGEEDAHEGFPLHLEGL